MSQEADWQNDFDIASQELDLNLKRRKEELKLELVEAMMNAKNTELDENGNVKALINEANQELIKTRGRSLDSKVTPKFIHDPNMVVIDAKDAMLYLWLCDEAYRLVGAPVSSQKTIVREQFVKHELLHLAASYDASKLEQPVLGIQFFRVPYQGSVGYAASPFVNFKGGEMSLEEYFKILEAPQESNASLGSDEIKLQAKSRDK